MTNYDLTITDLVTANRILAEQGVVDAFGHVSVRHPQLSDRFLLSCAKPPELVRAENILEYDLSGKAIVSSPPQGYLERFIHGALYEARPDIQCVIHNHSRSVIPFGVTSQKLRPIVHSSGTIGTEVPVWDAQHSFGDTDLLVSDIGVARDLAKTFASADCVLMRGHGCTVAGKSIREAVYTAYYLEVNARLQLDASRLGLITFLTSGEIQRVKARLTKGKPGQGFDRFWEYWCARVGMKFTPSS